MENNPNNQRAAAWYGAESEFYGIITEHEYLVSGHTRVNSDGFRVIDLDGAEDGILFLCSELVHINTEDGPDVGRCGTPVLGSDFMCGDHKSERVRWGLDGFVDYEYDDR